MVSVQQVLDIIEEHDFRIFEYTECGKVCGYEIESWTDGGCDMMHFIDLRDYDSGDTAQNIADELFEIYMAFDVDEEIDLHRQDARYRAAFSVSESVIDFNDYDNRLYALYGAVKLFIEKAR